ncbi:MAG TPA: diaminobutyrate acetyltransferase [Arenibaculum sp.]|jgi:L-2,4-diaminobutyric acid acetyltransferase|nr:diaminobutyrate acetyltransferase [Arenibaculum sp.]
MMRPARHPDASGPPSGVLWSEACDGLSLRNATFGDGADIWRLVGETGVLDLNSPYAYLMMGNWFADTSVVAAADGRLAGFVMGFSPPRQADTVFVWQVGVAAAMRGRGLGRRMLDALVRRSPGAIRYLEATVTPSNEASEALFRGFARSRAARCAVSDLFPSHAFPTGGHEAERLFRIGPLLPRQQ